MYTASGQLSWTYLLEPILDLSLFSPLIMQMDKTYNFVCQRSTILTILLIMYITFTVCAFGVRNNNFIGCKSMNISETTILILTHCCIVTAKHTLNLVLCHSVQSMTTYSSAQRLQATQPQLRKIKTKASDAFVSQTEPC